MTEMLVISNILLWVLVVALSLVVLALARQVGILHERVAPAGALQPTEGPKVGELTKAMALTSLDGRPVTVGGASDSGQSTFVLFISPTCPVSAKASRLSIHGTPQSRRPPTCRSFGATSLPTVPSPKSPARRA